MASPPLPIPPPRATSRGAALPIALFLLVLIGLLAAGMWRIAQAGALSSGDREVALEAAELAEAGVGHALALLNGSLKQTGFTRLLRGSDDLANTTDDGRLTGYGLAATVEIPAAGRAYGGGSYSVVLSDDPADGDGDSNADSNGRLVLVSVGFLPDGSTSTIRVVLRDSTTTGSGLGDGWFFQTDLKLASGYTFTGNCSQIHANQKVDVTTNSLIVDQYVSSADSVVGKTVHKSNGTVTPRYHGQPAVTVPGQNPLDYCTGADYILRRNGYVVKTATPRDSAPNPAYGWSCSGCGASSNEWEAASLSPSNAGKVCVEGSVKTSGVFGTSTSPLKLSIFASGSVKADASPTFQKASDGEKYVIMAGNDVSFGGGSTTVPNYTGIIYARGQCKISGSSGFYKITLLCRDDPPAAGEKDHFNTHSFGGSHSFQIDCDKLGPPSSGTTTVLRRRAGWSPSFGS